MDVEFVNELRLLVLSGDFGDKYYEISRMYTKIGENKDRYKFGGFSWKTIITSDAPALLRRDACDDVAGYRGKAKLPDDPEHLLKAFGADSIQQLIHDGVREAWEAGMTTPPNQLAIEEPTGYYSKLIFKKDKAYRYKSEYWLQMWNRESPVHMDHGRVVSYIPPCAKQCFKVWIFFPQEPTEQFERRNKEDSFNRTLDATTTEVLVQRAGNVVVLNNQVHHSVLLGYLPGTKDEDKWGGIFCDVIVRVADKIDSYKFATKAASGFRRDSEDAWRSLLSAYCVMNGDMWDSDEYDEIKANLIVPLDLPKESAGASEKAHAKWNKRRAKLEKMEKLRARKIAKQA